MADSGAQVSAELAYQRALAALHAARADLAEVAAARRRLAFERRGADPGGAEAREQALAVQHAELTDRAEPDEVHDEPFPGNFEQPPYLEQES